jgi:hypothetical protein
MVCPIDGRPIISAWLATVSLQQPSQYHPKILIILCFLLVVSWMVSFHPRLCSSIGGLLFFFSSRSFPGNNSSSVVDVYDCLTGAWSTTSLPSAGGQMASTSLRVKLYVPNTGASVTKDIAMFAGGVTSSQSEYFSTIDIFDGTRWITDHLKDASYSPLLATALDAKGLAIFAGGEDPECASSGYVIRIYFICKDTRFASSFFCLQQFGNQ